MNEFAIFAKHWQPGLVKTRLAAAIGAAPASELARLFFKMLMQRFAKEGDRRLVVFAPAEAESAFAQVAGENWQLLPQQGNALGQRLISYFDHAFASGAENVVVIGSDSPTLPAQYVAEAWGELNRGAAVVLGPSDDGGYYLVGAREHTPPIFDNIPWSTGEVWQHTIAELERSGIRYATLPPWYDVDEFADLMRLRDELCQAQIESAADEELRSALAAAAQGFTSQARS